MRYLIAILGHSESDKSMMICIKSNVLTRNLLYNWEELNKIMIQLVTLRGIKVCPTIDVYLRHPTFSVPQGRVITAFYKKVMILTTAATRFAWCSHEDNSARFLNTVVEVGTQVM